MVNKSEKQVTSYVVVKDFSVASVGDIFVSDPETGYYTMRAEDCANGGDYTWQTTRSMSLDHNSVPELVEIGYLEAIVEDQTQDKLEKIEKLMDELTDKYQAKITELCESQEIPECVKVEGETVYYNLLTLVNKINDIVKGNE